MTIVKHRTVDLPLEEIMKAAAAHKPPKGMAIDITEETTKNSSKKTPKKTEVFLYIEIKTRKILKLLQRGYGSLVFSDILKTRENLIQELHGRDDRKEKKLGSAAAHDTGKTGTGFS